MANTHRPDILVTSRMMTDISPEYWSPSLLEQMVGPGKADGIEFYPHRFQKFPQLNQRNYVRAIRHGRLPTNVRKWKKHYGEMTQWWHVVKEGKNPHEKAFRRFPDAYVVIDGDTYLLSQDDLEIPDTKKLFVENTPRFIGDFDGLFILSTKVTPQKKGIEYKMSRDFRAERSNTYFMLNPANLNYQSPDEAYSMAKPEGLRFMFPPKGGTSFPSEYEMHSLEDVLKNHPPDVVVIDSSNERLFGGKHPRVYYEKAMEYFAKLGWK